MSADKTMENIKTAATQAEQLEKDIRENLYKLQGSHAKAALKPASKPVDVSAEDFDDESDGNAD